MTSLPATTTDSAAFASYESRVGALESTLPALRQQAAAGGLGGAVDIYSGEAAHTVLYSPTPPDQSGGWTLVVCDANGAAATLPNALLAENGAFTRGAGHTIQDTVRPVHYKWTKTGQPTSAVQLVVFVDADTTPAPRAFDRGNLPNIVFGDVWQVVGLDYVDVPLAFTHVDDGSPYFMSKDFSIRGINGSIVQGLGWDAPLSVPRAFHPYHKTRGMIRFRLPDKSSTGTFGILLTATGMNSGNPVFTLSATVHVVSDASAIPPSYVPIVYGDDPDNFVPAYVGPTGTPTYDDDLIQDFQLVPYTGVGQISTTAWMMEEFTLNNGDFAFGVPGSTRLASGRVITQDDIFPVRTLPDGRKARALTWVDARNDQVVYKGGSQRFDWVTAALRRTIAPSYGWLVMHVTTPAEPGSNPPVALFGVDFSPWHYDSNTYEEHDRNESARGATSSNRHDVGGGNQFGFTGYDNTAYVGEHLRYYRLTAPTQEHPNGTETHWVGAPGQPPVFQYQGPNFYPTKVWPSMNILNEGPNGADGSGPAGRDYSQFQTLIHRLTSYDTDGMEAITYSSYAPVLVTDVDKLPPATIGFVQAFAWTPKVKGGDGTAPTWSLVSAGNAAGVAVDPATGTVTFPAVGRIGKVSGIQIKRHDATYDATYALPPTSTTLSIDYTTAGKLNTLGLTGAGGIVSNGDGTAGTTAQGDTELVETGSTSCFASQNYTLGLDLVGPCLADAAGNLIYAIYTGGVVTLTEYDVGTGATTALGTYDGGGGAQFIHLEYRAGQVALTIGNTQVITAASSITDMTKVGLRANAVAAKAALGTFNAGQL